MSLFRARIQLGRAFSPVDFFLFLGLFVLIYALVGVAFDWAGPFRPKTEIHLDLLSLLRYSLFSLVRVFLGYCLSLVFTLTYGYFAAKSRIAEPLLIPLLDILQSVPVLGFMPGLVLALVNLFPNSNFGLECAAIVMIFTGQGWNMVFSFYSSLKSVPGELREMGKVFRLGKIDVLRKIELPYAANGLLWNSMLSMAGGWFFLMVIESFKLGDKDFRLPGIGSYMAVAYERGETRAIFAGIAVMFFMIVVLDRCVWAPLVVWSERFKFDRAGGPPASRSMVLEWLKRSRILPLYSEWAEAFGAKLGALFRRLPRRVPSVFNDSVKLRRALWGVRLAVAGVGGVTAIYGMASMYQLVGATHGHTWALMFRDTFYTFLRVSAAVVIGSLWTIPVGVFIGTNPKWTARLQPVVQVVASFPAPMLFPAIVYLMLKAGFGMSFGSIALMVFASQWYILFNVISGATVIPAQMIELASAFQVRGIHYWRSIILPAIFPSLLNGWITAAGGAWNASIVSEWVQYGDKTLSVHGIGAAITQAAQAGDFPGLAGGILVMVTTVVLLNRFFWGALYRLAETRFRLEST